MTTLEKIRAEIEKIEPLDYPCDKRTPERIRDMALDIIDKYAYQEPKQPDICPIYDGMCGYPIEFCYECPRHPKQEPCEDAISREELLKAINTWDKFGYTETGCFVREPKGDYVPYIHYDDVVKAIKGMPSVQPKPIECEDAVSREAVLEIAKQHTLTNDYLAIQSLPPVRPQEPKTGHWITTRTLMHDGEYYCDKCNCDSPHNEKWDYCPNCGARMVEPQESEEA